MIDWVTNFTAKEGGTEGDITKIVLKGVLIDSSNNKNAWTIESEDFSELSKKYIGRQIRIDHGEKVSDVKGVVKNTEVDQPHTDWKEDWDPPNEHPHIHFIGELATADKNIIVPLKMGYVNQVSPGVDAKQTLCSVCKEPMEHGFKSCGCENSVTLLKEIEPRELSIIASPAYKNTLIKPYGFAAAINNIIRGEYMAEEEKKTVPFEDVENRMKKLEAAITALAMRYKAEEEEEEERMKAEEEEEETYKSEEEEEEVPKKTVPITRVAEEEGQEEEEEEEEEEKKAEEEERKMIASLVAEVRKLKKAVAAYKADDGKVTPNTPEDEPEWKIIKPPAVSNSPVKSTKTDKIHQTPSMKPGKIKAGGGKQAGISGAGFKGQISKNAEDLALTEVFSFAASKGVVPISTDRVMTKIRV